METSMSATRQIARERARAIYGPDHEPTEEELDDCSPKATPVPDSPGDAGSARAARRQRTLSAHPKPRREPGPPVYGAPR